jgi:hypothetical protein
MSAPVTQWFEADEKPVRAGYYQRDYGSSNCTSQPDYWTGREWRYGLRAGLRCLNQHRMWRGLSEKPA